MFQSWAGVSAQHFAQLHALAMLHFKMTGLKHMFWHGLGCVIAVPHDAASVFDCVCCCKGTAYVVVSFLMP